MPPVSQKLCDLTPGASGTVQSWRRRQSVMVMHLAACRSHRRRSAKPAATFLSASWPPSGLPCFDGQELPLWTFSADNWLPVVCINSDDRLDVVLENRLPQSGEHTSIHWHGIRLPNAEDGLPYLVRCPNSA